MKPNSGTTLVALPGASNAPHRYSGLMLHHLLTQFSPTLLVSTVLLTSFLTQQAGSPLLFLPAGVQLLAALIYDTRCLPGCIIGIGLGTMLTNPPSNDSSLAIGVFVGALSTVCLLSFIHLTCRLGQFDDDLTGIQYRHVLVIAFWQAVTDAALRTTFMPLPEQNPLPQLLLQASGNMLGSMSVAFTIWVLAALMRMKERSL